MLLYNKWWQGFYEFEYGKYERCSHWFVEHYSMDKKIKQKEEKIGEGMHWKWDVAPKVENSCKNKVC